MLARGRVLGVRAAEVPDDFGDADGDPAGECAVVGGAEPWRERPVDEGGVEVVRLIVGVEADGLQVVEDLVHDL